MAQQTLGEIRLFSGNYAPRGWALCKGQLVTISSNQALYSLLGTVYGGDGRTTFALPDLRGKAVVGTGQGAGLSNRIMGQWTGAEEITLTTNNLAGHSHSVSSYNLYATMAVSDTPPNSTNPNGNYLTTQASPFFASSSTPGQYLQEAEVKYEVDILESGGQQIQSVNLMGPSLVLNYIIAITGQYPRRSD